MKKVGSLNTSRLSLATQAPQRFAQQANTSTSNGTYPTLRTVLRQAGMTIVIAAMLSLSHGVAHATSASMEAASEKRVVALDYQAPTKMLLKATPKAVHTSTDEGHTWHEHILPPSLTKSRVTDIAVSVRDPSLLFVAGADSGVWRSNDGGKNWVMANKGLPKGKVRAVTAHSTHAETVYAYVDGKGIFRSQDAGRHWRLMDSGPRQGITQFIHSNMAGSMETGWLFAATPKGVWRSMDCFCGWHRAGASEVGYFAVTYDPTQPERVYASSGTGLFVSADGGEQWAALPAAPGSATTLFAAPNGYVYAADKKELFRSADRGATWEKIE